MAFGRLNHQMHPPVAEINMIPLIDVMLVLLVIFIVTAPLVSQSVKLQLPETVELQSDQPKIPPVMIALDANHTLTINNRLIVEADVSQVLADLKAGENVQIPLMIHLHIDASVSYEHVAKLLAQLSQAGLTNIGFVSLPEQHIP